MPPKKTQRPKWTAQTVKGKYSEHFSDSVIESAKARGDYIPAASNAYFSLWRRLMESRGGIATVYEVGGTRTFTYDMRDVDEVGFASFFEREVRPSLLKLSESANPYVDEETGRAKHFPYASSNSWIVRENKPTRALLKAMNWKNGDRNCLVAPVHDRIEARVALMRASYQAKPSRSKLSHLRKFEGKLAVCAKVLQSVKEVGCSTDWVTYLCRTINISIEVRSVVTAVHSIKCAVCLSFVVDSAAHVCGKDGSTRTVDYVTLFKCDETKSKNDLSFSFIETVDNHVEYAGDGNVKRECFITSMEDAEEVEELDTLYSELVTRGEMFVFRKSAEGAVTRIQRPFAPPVVTKQNGFWDMHREFMKETGLELCQVDAVAEPELSSFVVRAMGHNTTFDFADLSGGAPDWMRLVDMRRAYANAKLCTFYSGYVGKIHEFRKMDRMLPDRNGIYYVDSVIAPPHLMSDFTHSIIRDGVHTSPELRYWSSIGVTYDVRAGCIGADIDFDFNDYDYMMEKQDFGVDSNGETVGIRGYCLSTGIMQRHSLTETHLMFVGDGGMQRFRGNPNVYCDENLRTATLVYPKSSCLHLCHVVSFIFAYVRISVMQQVLAMGHSPMRVCVDGIYYDSRVYSPPPMSDSQWHEKWNDSDRIRIGNDACATYVCRDMAFSGRHVDSLSSRPTAGDTETLICGMGGNGKSHAVCTDVYMPSNPSTAKRLSGEVGTNGGLVRAVLLVPTLRQMREKRESYPGVRVVTHAHILNFISMPGHPNVSSLVKFSNVLLVDECSMLPDTAREDILRVFTHHKIIWLGDVGFQCPPFPIADEDTGVKMHRPEFSAAAVPTVVELTHNYRIKDPALYDLCIKMRKIISDGGPGVDAMAASLVRSTVKRTQAHDIRSYYHPGDLIICRTHDQIRSVTRLVCAAFEQYKTSTGKLIPRLEGPYAAYSVVDYTPPDSKLPPRSVMHCHGFTVHAAQGETVQSPRNVILCMQRQMEARVLYTAVTRCEYLSQLHFYEDSTGVGGGDVDECTGGDEDSSDEYDAIMDDLERRVIEARSRAWRETGKRQAKRLKK